MSEKNRLIGEFLAVKSVEQQTLEVLLEIRDLLKWLTPPEAKKKGRK